MHAARRTTARTAHGAPIIVGRRWVFPDGRSVPVVAGADDDQSVDLSALEKIEDVPDDDLDTHETNLVEEFDRLLDEGKETGKPNKARMTELATAIKKVRDEKVRRETETQADLDEADRLAKEVHGTDTDPDDPDGDGGEGGDPQPEGDPAPADDPDAVETPDPAKEPVTAAAGAPAAKGPSASATAAHSKKATPPAAPRVTIVAAAGVPGFNVGQQLDTTQVAVALHEVAATLPDRSHKVKVARMRTPYAKNRTIGKAMSAEAGLEIIEDATKRPTSAQALVAAGGWCTPSVNLYDLFALTGQTGLLDLPSIGIERGGVNIPAYIGWDAAIDGALWVWSEAQDSDVTLTITDLDIVSGVGTMTSTAHLLAVGDIVEVNVGTAADGPRTVTAVTSADVVTLDMTGVADASNLTGVGTRQKSCFEVPCTTWTEERLAAYGICIKNGNLQERAFPELTRRFVQVVMDAHAHRMSAVHLAKIRTNTHSEAVPMTTVATDAAGEILNAIDLQVADYRSEHMISANVVLEALFPTWVHAMIRANMAMRAGVDMMNITNAQITGWFTAREIRPQFLEDYQILHTGTPAVAWPTELEFIVYPAGGFFEGNGGTLDLAVQRDSRLNATNDHTVAFTEDFRLLGRRGPRARRITIPTLAVNGVTACCA